MQMSINWGKAKKKNHPQKQQQQQQNPAKPSGPIE
jgi:hypothetical protein